MHALLYAVFNKFNIHNLFSKRVTFTVITWLIQTNMHAKSDINMPIGGELKNCDSVTPPHCIGAKLHSC